MAILKCISMFVLAVGAAFTIVAVFFAVIFIVVYAIVTAEAALKKRLRRNNKN